jgi:hypothetical protein
MPGLKRTERAGGRGVHAPVDSAAGQSLLLDVPLDELLDDESDVLLDDVLLDDESFVVPAFASFVAPSPVELDPDELDPEVLDPAPLLPEA